MADESAQGSFKTHANYIEAFSMLCRAPYNSAASPITPFGVKDLALLGAVAAKSPTVGPTANATPDLDQTKASLANAWGTELLLTLGATLAFEEELVRLMNNWAVVQTYYAAYHGTQSLLVAKGIKRPESHPKTQKLFIAMWCDRQVQLPPWSFGATASGYTNLPSGRTINESLSNWSMCDSSSCWDLAAKPLRTTRREKVAERFRDARIAKQKAAKKAWETDEQMRLAKGRQPRKTQTYPMPNLKAGEKGVVDASTRTFSMLDYLYRLRIKTNYQDATMFTEGPTDQSSSIRVHRDLQFITASTLLVHEIHVASIVGKEVLLRWADDWLARNSPTHELGLAQRRSVLDDIC